MQSQHLLTIHVAKCDDARKGEEEASKPTQGEENSQGWPSKDASIPSRGKKRMSKKHRCRLIRKVDSRRAGEYFFYFNRNDPKQCLLLKEKVGRRKCKKEERVRGS